MPGFFPKQFHQGSSPSQLGNFQASATTPGKLNDDILSKGNVTYTDVCTPHTETEPSSQRSINVHQKKKHHLGTQLRTSAHNNNRRQLVTRVRTRQEKPWLSVKKSWLISDTRMSSCREEHKQKPERLPINFYTNEHLLVPGMKKR